MVFNAYAEYYDLLYKNKEYAAEAEYVATLLKRHKNGVGSILELGCGTGAHAELLARIGFEVHGIDLSREMLVKAEARKASLPAEVAARLTFSHGDVRSVRTGRTYDAVISLFHVMSYQTSNTDFKSAFETVATHLAKGGIFLFDFWYGPAVLLQKPEVRVKRLVDAKIVVTRIAEPVMHLNENVVVVNYSMFIEDKASKAVHQVSESHRMRYVFLPELIELSAPKFTEVASHAWLSDAEPCADSWAVVQVLERA